MKVRIPNGQSWFYRMRRVLATLCLALLTVFVGHKVVFGANGMKAWQAKRVEAVRLQQEIERMKADRDELQRHVDGLQRGEPSMIEKEAREQLGYVKPGEVVLFEQRAQLASRTSAVAANTGQK
jgi:cell division protein FtsB